MNKNLLPVTIEIKAEWQKIAYNFALEQHQKQHQIDIFQNTLAILGLQEYLRWGEVETALTSSYSWHPYTRILTGWADLFLPEYGRLLCCLYQEENLIDLPEILPINCIGCVVVKIAPDHSTLELQGFIPHRLLNLQSNVEANHFSLAEVGAIATLFDELYLLTEERLLVEQAMLRLSTIDDDLEAYFLPLLDSENIIDIVGRLNRLFYEPTDYPENIFIIDEVDEETPENMFVCNEPQEMEIFMAGADEVELDSLICFSPLVKEDTDLYDIDTPQSKIEEATQFLTEHLLFKLKELRDELS